MTDLRVDVKLDHIFCHDEGDGPGSAEPYLWAVYFKVDGETVVVNTDGPAPPFLQGPPVVVGTPGDHANLGNTDVDEGDTVAIPAIIGEFHTTMTPIPLTTPLLGVESVGGLLGAIVVLMEEDNTSASAIAQGHAALDSSVRDRIAEVMGTSASPTRSRPRRRFRASRTRSRTPSRAQSARASVCSRGSAASGTWTTRSAVPCSGSPTVSSRA